MLGACVEPPPAVRPCERGRARNLDDGACLTRRETRDLARAAGVYVDDEDAVVCEAKADDLVASRRLGQVGCVTPRPPSADCPASSVRAGGACVSLSRGGALDVAAWSRAAAAELCERLVRGPIVLVAPETALEVDLHASIPNNDLTLGFIRVASRPEIFEPDRAAAVAAIDDAMRRLATDGRSAASASDVHAAAACRASSRRPISVP